MYLVNDILLTVMYVQLPTVTYMRICGAVPCRDVPLTVICMCAQPGLDKLLTVTHMWCCSCREPPLSCMCAAEPCHNKLAPLPGYIVDTSFPSRAPQVWDDQAVWNADYCTVLPDVTVDSMNQLERAVLELLFYNVSVSSAEYAQHYFDLRMYAHKADIEDGIMLSPLDVRKARQLEAMNHIHQTDTEHTALKRVSSTDNFEPPSRHVIIS